MIWFWINDELKKHTNKSILLLCILCGKWFWINDQLKKHITFEHPINTPLVHFVWKMILNQRSPEEPYYIWAPNQFTIPLSLHLPRSHLEFHSLPCCLLLENSVPASCVVKIFQSIHGWRCTLFLNIKPIHKTSLSPSSSFTSGVCSASVPSGTYVKKHKYDFSGIIFLSRRRTYRCICRELFSTHDYQMSTKKITCGTQAVAAERMRWRDPMVTKPRLLRSPSLRWGMWRTSTSSSTNLSMLLARPWKRKILFLWKIHSRTQHLATEEVFDIVMVGDTPTDHEKGKR